MYRNGMLVKTLGLYRNRKIEIASMEITWPFSATVIFSALISFRSSFLRLLLAGHLCDLRNNLLHSSPGVELSAIATMNITEDSTMERMLCVQLVNIYEGLERSVFVTVAPVLEGFSTTG